MVQVTITPPMHANVHSSAIVSKLRYSKTFTQEVAERLNFVGGIKDQDRPRAAWAREKG
ncbi:unnamed protein product [Prorocentrum cordatum]|uniref:Uncharacterized protein n=1 Tax=Prorocentrum cordatum TaxID=2364126 RepID=A0ABN9WY87_9DINO|nr:unnamed protein product [Polarella glacialis]